jgi:hypothetical protein
MRGRFYATEQISDNIEKTPEGFLVLHEVPLARTGVQLYGPDEVPSDVPANPDGFIQIERTPEEVFRPETIASANGKPFVNEHPVKGNDRLDVTSDNWREFSCGTIINPRQGEGIADDLLFGDIIVYDPTTIDDILSKKKRQVSLGYDAEYEILGEGHAKQTNILINHGAAVEQGRCGPRCAIRDEEGAMAGTTAKKATVLDFLRRAYRARDAGEFETIEKEAAEMEPGNGADPGGGPDEHHIHVHLPGGEKEKENDEMRSNTRFTDPPPNGGEEPNGGGGNMEQRILAAIQDLSSRVEALEDAMGAGHGGGTAQSPTDSSRDDRRRDDRRRDARGRDADEEDCQDAARDEEPNASEEGANESTEAILGQIEFEAPPGTADRMRKARDSANPFFQDIFQETRASCEIIAPGMRLPTFDRAASPTKTFDCICDMRRQALQKAYDDPEIHNELDAILAHQPLDTRSMPVRDLSVLFRAVASHKRTLNNSHQSRDTGGGGTSINASYRGPPTPAEINARNKAFKEAGGWGPGAGVR